MLGIIQAQSRKLFMDIFLLNNVSHNHFYVLHIQQMIVKCVK